MTKDELAKRLDDLDIKLTALKADVISELRAIWEHIGTMPGGTT